VEDTLRTVDFDANVTWRRLRSAGELSRAAKILWFVWALILSGRFPPELIALTSLGAGLGLVAMTLSFKRSTGATSEGTVRVGGGRVAIWHHGGVVTLDRGSTASAHAYGPTVEITATNGDVWQLVLADAAAAQAVVRELGFGHAGTPVIFDTAEVSRAVHVGYGVLAFSVAAVIGRLLVVLLGLRFGHVLGVPVVLALTAIFYETTKKRFRAPAVTVGPDGVRIDEAEGELIPLDQILAVEQRAFFAPLRLHLANGRIVTIDGGGIAAKRNALAIHLYAMLATNQESPGLGLARDGLGVRAWRERLRNALNVGGYRVAARAPVDAALAERMVAPRISAEERVGAALALRIADPAYGAARVRVAAECCLDPHVRAALEAAAAEEIDDDAIERALGPGAPRRFPTLQIE